MDTVVSLWKAERRARWFFGAHLQSGLGAGAGYIALLVLAYDRIGSAWGATAILLADLLPAMLLGPLLGAAIDRTSKLGAAILADVVRALAFAGLVIFDGTLSMVVLAFLAGPGPRCSARRPTRCCRGWSPPTGCRRPTACTAPCARPASCWARRSPPACSRSRRPRSCSASTPSPSPSARWRCCRCAGTSARSRSTPGAETGPESVRDVLRNRLVRTLMATRPRHARRGHDEHRRAGVRARRAGRRATGFGLLVSAYGFGLIGGSLYAGRERGRRAPPLLRRARRARRRAGGHRRRADARGRDGVLRRRGRSATACSRSATARCSTARSRSASTAGCSASSTPATAGASASPWSPAARWSARSAAVPRWRSPARRC